MKLNLINAQMYFQLLRIQSPNGTKRIECDANESTETFIKKVYSYLFVMSINIELNAFQVQKEFDIEDLFSLSVFKDRSHKQQIPLHERKTLNDYNLKHGDLLFLVLNKSEVNHENEHNATTSASGTSLIDYRKNSIVSNGVFSEEDDVDVFLSTQTGLIEKKVDEKLCRHGAHAKCVHCTPMEPYDEAYLRDHNIKHMSFHSFLRKMKGGIDK